VNFPIRPGLNRFLNLKFVGVRDSFAADVLGKRPHNAVEVIRAPPAFSTSLLDIPLSSYFDLDIAFLPPDLFLALQGLAWANLYIVAK
jgi:hypothetical protein